MQLMPAMQINPSSMRQKIRTYSGLLQIEGTRSERGRGRGGGGRERESERRNRISGQSEGEKKGRTERTVSLSLSLRLLRPVAGFSGAFSPSAIICSLQTRPLAITILVRRSLQLCQILLVRHPMKSRRPWCWRCMLPSKWHSLTRNGEPVADKSRTPQIEQPILSSSSIRQTFIRYFYTSTARSRI